MRFTARSFAHATLLALVAATVPAAFAAEPAKAAAKAAPKAATPHQQLKNQAKGLALATETVEEITEAQLSAAMRVLTGDADCEFNQKVIVNAVEGKPGHFNVGFKKVVYRMVPQETTTGAVRLEDKKAGVMWLQIPTKSMLMNAKVGQRMVDACTHSEQRAAIAASEAAARSMRADALASGATPATATSLGIAPSAAPPAAGLPPSAAAAPSAPAAAATAAPAPASATPAPEPAAPAASAASS